MFFKNIFSFLVLLCFFGLLPHGINAQTPEATSTRVWEKARAMDASSVLADQTKIALWGVEIIEGMDALFKLSARYALDSAMDSGKIECTVRGQFQDHIAAQCTNKTDLDLGLLMLQQGFVIADRSAVYGTIFESPYLQAETQARNQKLGVWAVANRKTEGQTSDNQWMVLLTFVFFAGMMVTFSILSITMLRGFQKVIEAQKQGMSLVERERSLKNKEREIFAMMLDSEIKANKSKIQAYLAVYDEMLKSLKIPDRAPKYQKGGDVFQAQPALDRAVFDRNTDKMDILGDRLSSAVIHFYARIKSHSEYITIEPDMTLEDVLAILEKALKNATILDKGADRLIDLFSQGGHSSKERYSNLH